MGAVLELPPLVLVQVREEIGVGGRVWCCDDGDNNIGVEYIKVT